MPLEHLQRHQLVNRPFHTVQIGGRVETTNTYGDFGRRHRAYLWWSVWGQLLRFGLGDMLDVKHAIPAKRQQSEHVPSEK